MRNLPRWPLFLLIPLLCCAISASLIYAFWFDPNFGCFGTFDPSQADVERRVNLRFPPSTSNVEWECQPGLVGDTVSVRFKIASGEMQDVIESPSYSVRSFDSLPQDFFDLFDDIQVNEANLAVYNVWQGSSAWGQTDVLVDRHDPELYTIYAVYQDRGA